MIQDHQLVSIIVPTYKNFSNLNENFCSIVNQTYNNLEVIITDDGSPNFDMNIIEKLLDGNNLSAKIIHHAINIGTVKNINNAIKQATGEFIFFLAQDDRFFANDTVEKIIACFKADDYVICTRPYIHNGINKKIPNSVLTNPRKLYKYLMLFENPFSGACTYYRKDVFNKFGLFDENMRYLEDYPYYVHLSRNNIPIKFIDIHTIIYSTDGISSNRMNPLLLNDLRIMYDRELSIGYHSRYANFKKANSYLCKILFYPDIVLYNLFNKVTAKI